MPPTGAPIGPWTPQATPPETRLQAAEWLLRRTNPFLQMWDMARAAPQYLHNAPGALGNSINDFLAVTTPSQRTTEGIPSRTQLYNAASVAVPETGSLPLAGVGAAARMGEGTIFDALGASPGPALGAAYGVRPNRLNALWHGSVNAPQVLQEGFRKGTNVEYMLPGVSTSSDPSLALHFTREDPWGNPDKVMRALPMINPDEVRNIRPSENAFFTGTADPQLAKEKALSIPAGGLDESEIFFPQARKNQRTTEFANTPPVVPVATDPSQRAFVERSGYKFKFTDELKRFEEGLVTDTPDNFVPAGNLLKLLQEKPKFGGVQRRFDSLRRIPRANDPKWESALGKINQLMFPQETLVLQGLAEKYNSAKLAIKQEIPYRKFSGPELDDYYRAMNKQMQSLDKEIESAAAKHGPLQEKLRQTIGDTLQEAIAWYGPQRTLQKIEEMKILNNASPLQIAKQLEDATVADMQTHRQWGLGPTAPSKVPSPFDDPNNLGSGKPPMTIDSAGNIVPFEPARPSMDITPWTAEDYAKWSAANPNPGPLEQQPFNPGAR